MAKNRILVEARRERIRLMRESAKTVTKDWGSMEKKEFIARYCVATGVRERLANEYFQMLVNGGFIEEDEENGKFKSLEVKEE